MAPTPGILPDRALRALFDEGAIVAGHPLDADQIQPASLDLRLGRRVWRLRASFLPGSGRRVSERLQSDFTLHEIDLTGGAVLETGCVYLAELAERVALPGDVAAAMNPKSSTGRLDVFTRVIGDGAEAFDQVPAGYAGPLYVEICPRTFSILARPGDRLVQARLRRGAHAPTRSVTLSVDLAPANGGPVGYRAKRHSPLVDLKKVGAHDPAAFWEPIYAADGYIVLDPGEFYILASREAVEIPLHEAAEMAPIAPEIGEFRAHYAGFFDPGFGVERAGGKGSRAVLEVRGRDVPFILEHGQPVAKLVYEPCTTKTPGQVFDYDKQNGQIRYDGMCVDALGGASFTAGGNFGLYKCKKGDRNSALVVAGASTRDGDDDDRGPLSINEGSLDWEGKGGFNVTSTCEFSDEMCQRKCPLFENSTRDDLSSKNESKRVKTDRDTSLER